jgi:transketolase
MDIFLKQDRAYQNEVLPEKITARVAVEAAASDSWYRFVGREGRILGLDRFGASAPAKDVYQDCGLTLDKLLELAREVAVRNKAPLAI